MGLVHNHPNRVKKYQTINFTSENFYLNSLPSYQHSEPGLEKPVLSLQQQNTTKILVSRQFSTMGMHLIQTYLGTFLINEKTNTSLELTQVPLHSFKITTNLLKDQEYILATSVQGTFKKITDLHFSPSGQNHNTVSHRSPWKLVQVTTITMYASPILHIVQIQTIMEPIIDIKHCGVLVIIITKVPNLVAVSMEVGFATLLN